jgi:nickel transport protein
MTAKLLRPFLLAFALLPILIQPVFAHVIWFGTQTEEGYELLFGHPEEGPEPYDPSKFRSATAYDQNKQIIPIEVAIDDSVSVIPQGDVAALTALYDNGFWLRNPEDTASRQISQAEAEAIGYTNVTRFLKSTKALLDWSEDLSTPFGLPLEIMPLENPVALKAGDTLPIQILYEGSLIKDALVEYEGAPLEVNEMGIAYVPFTERGLQPIEASYQSSAATNPGLSYATTLTVRPVPEPASTLGLLALGVFGGGSFLKKPNVRCSPLG